MAIPQIVFNEGQSKSAPAARESRATSDVMRNLQKESGIWLVMGQRFSRTSVEDYAAEAKRWLKDNTELSTKTIESADYSVAFAYFAQGGQEEPAQAPIEPTKDRAEAEKALRDWKALADAVNRDRDAVVRVAIAAGMTKMEIHQATGISRCPCSPRCT